MSKPRRKVAYFILVLLVLLVVAIIGGLWAVLFNMKPAVPSRHKTPPMAPTAPLTNVVDGLTPVAEVRIDLPPEGEPEPPTEANVPKQDAGIIPTVCDGYGPQILERKAYWGPTTYKAAVKPARVTFTVNLGDRRAAGGVGNTP